MKLTSSGVVTAWQLSMDILSSENSLWDIVLAGKPSGQLFEKISCQSNRSLLWTMPVTGSWKLTIGHLYYQINKTLGQSDVCQIYLWQDWRSWLASRPQHKKQSQHLTSKQDALNSACFKKSGQQASQHQQSDNLPAYWSSQKVLRRQHTAHLPIEADPFLKECCIWTWKDVLVDPAKKRVMSFQLPNTCT